MPHEQEGAQPVDALIDDLILDILNESKETGTGLEAVMTMVPRMAPGTSLLERMLIAEALAGALADALAPALAKALAPRIVQHMSSEEGEHGEQSKRPPARSGGARKTETK
ncbi:hypothetical protein AB0M46_42720 [Dactylosporangium sp. NPDC051485]|uniref:hypothetical protein n=1 Tax=Dactylosporangium sp. NPDC051485 TaxID=3154846 RepID=UPI00342A4D1B